MERIGILLVHGIGEQKRFEHLKGEVEPLVDALREQVGAGGRVTVEIIPGGSDLPGAESASWASDARVPVRVLTETAQGAKQIFEFREVWWSDLDEPVNVPNFLRFCSDVLKLHKSAGRGRSAFFEATDNSTLMRLARFPHPDGTEPKTEPNRTDVDLRPEDRSAVFWLGVLAVGVALPATGLNWLLHRYFGRILPILTTLHSYLNDVMMMSQRARRGGGTLEDRGDPVRVAIRRRTVRAICHTALGDYSRWYVLAHSLGTVVAHNGLNELAHTLPNYVDADLRAKLEQAKVAGPARQGDALANVDVMRPARPAQLDPNFVVYRDKLFERFGGLMTYGSPLDKFAAIWPMVVATTPDDAPLTQNGAEWINAWSAQDPVSAKLDAFHYAVDHGRTTRPTKFKPRNFEVETGCTFLAAHLRYFANSNGKASALAKDTVRWMSSGTLFNYSGASNDDATADRIDKKGWTLVFCATVVFSTIVFGTIAKLLFVESIAAAYAAGFAATIGLGACIAALSKSLPASES
jgi:hypothetical protein